MKSLINYLVLISLLIISCRRIFFNEDENTRDILLKDFQAVRISGIYNILLVQDSTNRLTIYGKNNINAVDAFINDDTLIIDDHKKMALNGDRNTLTLHFTNLQYMATHDPVSISNTDTIKADMFYYDALGEISEISLVVNCSYLYVVVYRNSLGFLKFRGKTDGCTFINSYGCSIFAGSLYCKDAEIDNSSAGDVFINASGNLKALIRGTGNIYYYGTPVIEIEEGAGRGKVIRLN